MVKQTTALLILLVFTLTSCASGKKAPPEISSSPVSQEVAFGEKINQEILAAFHPYTDPKVTGYLNEVGAKLAGHAGRRELPYHVTLLYNDKVYANSAPGGFIYLTTGMIFFLEDEAQLAAVLAHEIGELQYKNPKLSQARKLFDSVVNGGAAVAPALGQFGALALLGIIMAKAVADHNTPTLEQRVISADEKALHYMMDAGYDPQGFIDLHQKFLNVKEEALPYFYDYYQSRPMTVPRMQAILEVFKKLPLENRTLSTNRAQFFQNTKGVKEIYKT